MSTSGSCIVMQSSATAGRAAPRFFSAFAALLGLSLIVPNLNYFRIPPIFDFMGEWVSALMFGLAALVIVPALRNGQRVNSALLAPTILLGLLILLQLAFGRYEFPHDWILWLGYLGIATLAMLLGQALTSQDLRIEIISRLVWTFCLIGLLNFALQLLQVLELEWVLGRYILPLEQRSICRPYGNIGQANHVATVVWTAVAGTLYMAGLGKLRWAVAIPVTLALLVSASLTASRMAWISLGVVSSLIVFVRAWPADSKKSRLVTAGGLVGAFAICSVAVAPLLTGLNPACTTGIERLAGDGAGLYAIRLELWRQALMVWQQFPLFGVGAGSFMGSVYALQPLGQHQPLDYFAHNMAFGLLAEFGLVGAGAVAAIVVTWLVTLFRQRHRLTPQAALLIAWLGILGGHAMLEQPLHYVQWVIPFGLWLGLLMQPEWSRVAVSVPLRSVVLISSLGTIAACLWLFGDFNRLDRVLYLVGQQRSMGLDGDANMRKVISEAKDDVKLFKFHAEHAASISFQYRLDDKQEMVDLYDRIVFKGPTVASIYRRVFLAIYVGDLQGARWHLQRLFMFFPELQEANADQMRKTIDRYPEDFSPLLPILEDEVRKAPKARW